MLALAFAARAVVALSGDFVVHPDEIMQYLEPAHRLVFGNGVTHWEYFYGARSWLVPGTVAGVLMLFDAVGLGQPFWYVGGVKLLFCVISLSIPAGMYVFARRHFGETAGRAALLAGAFWYELVGFAHKPMTEFVATAPLVALLALCVRRSVDDARTVWTAAFLAASRQPYGCSTHRLPSCCWGSCFCVPGRGFSSHWLPPGSPSPSACSTLSCGTAACSTPTSPTSASTSFSVMRAGESPAYQFLLWLTLAGLGLSVLCVAAALRHLRRYGFLLGLIAMILLVHSLQAHKEYRYIFAVIPLWLLVGSDLAARLAARADGLRRLAGFAMAVFAAVSLVGILNGLPYQDRVYRAWSRETGVVSFLRNQDPIFPAYRYLSRAPGVSGIWQVDRAYYNLPGYYYLHSKIPFYDGVTGSSLKGNVETVSSLVSHIVSTDPGYSVPGYSLEQEFGEVRILRRDRNEPLVRPWLDHAPVMVSNRNRRIMRRIDPGGPSPPANFGIRFADRERP